MSSRTRALCPWAGAVLRSVARGMNGREEAIPAEGYIPGFLEGMALRLKGKNRPDDPPDENVQPTAKNSGWYGVRDCQP